MSAPAFQVIPDVWLPDGTVLRGNEVLGLQEPRFWTAPPRHREQDPACGACTHGDMDYTGGCGNFQSEDLLAWAPEVGYTLDPWQSWWLTEACGTKPDGRWAAREAMLIVSRQNGKNQCLEVRELGGLFVFGERMIIHTAHEFKAAAEHFRRVRDVVTEYDELRKRVKGIVTSHGEEAIELKAVPTLIFGSGGTMIRRKVGARLRFLARSRGSGRSFTADCVVYDEAMILSDEQVGASMPTMSAVANPQMIYTASAGYKDSIQLGGVRRRVQKQDPSLMGAEWSILPHLDTCPRDEVKGRPANRYIVCGLHDDRDDPRAWAKANPALGTRIEVRHVMQEMASMSASPHIFDRERLGVGDWPAEEEPWSVITQEQWQACAMTDPGGATRPVVFAVDVDPELNSATIAAVWERPADEGGVPRGVLEIPRGCHREGVAWIIPRLLELRRAWKPASIIMPKNGPAAGQADSAIQAGLEITAATPADEAAAFALMVTSARDRKIIHLGKDQAPGLWQSVATAETRDVGDGGRAWSRRDSASDITPVTAATLAYWGFNRKRRNYDPLKSIA